MKSKAFAAAIFVCMLLTACGVKTALEGSSSALTAAPADDNTVTTSAKQSGEITTQIALPTTALPAATTTAPTMTTAAPPVMTELPETTLEVPETETPPVVTEAPVTEAPVTEVPVTEAPVTEAPVTEAPVTDVPVTDAPVTTPAPQTTAEPVLNAIPKAYDVIGQVPASPAADPSWFDDACFIGDSVTEGLKTYCLSGRLGDAKFFAVRNYSTINALRLVSAGGPHPSYQGVKMTSEDCVMKSGAKKVFIMLGINEISYGVNPAVKRYKQLVDRILEKSPDAQIFVQSVTPMTSTSTYTDDMLNNTNIRRFNEKMKQACEENGWYYLDIASVVVDETGVFLNREICSDKNSMGIHFNTKGYKLWVNYLLTHTVDFTPAPPEESESDPTEKSPVLPVETTADESIEPPAEPTKDAVETTAPPVTDLSANPADSPETSNIEQE